MNNSILNYFNIVVNKIIDIIIPKDRNILLLEELGPNGLFDKIPRAERFNFETDKIRAIFNYKNNLCRQAIWEIKYRANKKLIRDFSILLYEYIIDDLADLGTFGNFQKPTLIPIPCSKVRLREKGFNQCILICRELIKIDKERNGDNFTLVQNLLIKQVDTPHQTRVSNRSKRLENLKGSFTINSAGFLTTELKNSSNLSFILIDDVITTGATMREAFRTLQSAGISPRKIRGFALAH